MSNADNTEKSQNETTQLSFEAALNELEDIVVKLDSGDISLDNAINAYTRGMELKTHCQARLEEARLKVEQIKIPRDGGPVSTKPFEQDK